MVHQSVRKVVGFGTMDEVEQGGQSTAGRAEQRDKRRLSTCHRSWQRVRGIEETNELIL